MGIFAQVAQIAVFVRPIVGLSAAVAVLTRLR